MQFILPTMALLAAVAMTAPTVVPPHCTPGTVRIGNGNPHQSYYNVQVSDNIECDNKNTCNVARLTQKTIGWDASASITEWIPGGFSVSTSYTTGDQYQCDGNPGQTICVFDKVAYTAYTVENTNEGTVCGKTSSPIVLKSPNTNNAGGYYFCAYGSACHYNGYNYWNYQ